MKRRDLLIVLAAVGGAAAFKLRPSHRGAPHDPYFAGLDALLKDQGPARPCLVLDLDRLDHNLAVFKRDLHPSKQWRVVAKSLPSVKLLDYVMRAHGTERLMVFHQPFLNLQAQAFPEADLLLGKPMPVRAAAAFYDAHQGSFDPARQLQWLVDTPARVAEYRSLARGLGTRLNLNIELDVGLHRGGVADDLTLLTMLEQIAEDPQHLRFSGFMGYDPHVVKLPRLLGSPADLQAQSWARYRDALNLLAAQRPEWRNDALTLNGAGSPNYVLQGAESPLNEVGVGSALVQPTDFDLPTLAAHVPALFIATPVLKVLEGTRLPGVEPLSSAFQAWDPNQARSHFIYGGNWKAQPVSPPGLQLNALFGRSSNQELLNGAAATDLKVGDHVFLRPTQSEALMLQFGDLLVVRGGRIEDHWPVFGS